MPLDCHAAGDLASGMIARKTLTGRYYRLP
jgi:hypothetical protein